MTDRHSPSAAAARHASPNVARLARLAAAAVTLTSCASGGDDLSVSIALDPAQAIHAEVLKKQSMRTRYVYGRASGDLASLRGHTVYVVAEDPLDVFQVEPLVTADGRFELAVWTGPLTTTGRVTGTLKVHAYLDAEGSSELPGSPLLLPYDVTVVETLAVDSTLLVETTFGDAPVTRAIHATLSPYAATWSARIEGPGYQGCSGNDVPMATGLPFQRIHCTADGTFSLTFLPNAPGTYTETVLVNSSVDFEGARYLFEEEVLVTYVVAPNDGLDWWTFPPSLSVTRTQGDYLLEQDYYWLAPNTGVAVQWEAVEYLSNPPAADGHPLVHRWWWQYPYVETNTCVTYSSGAKDCLPAGTYTARLRYAVTRDGVQHDAYYPITMEIVQ